MPTNSIKIRQIDNAELLEFLQESMGLTIIGNATSHDYNEVFEGAATFLGDTQFSGNTTLYGQTVFQSGWQSNGNVSVAGNISGSTIAISNFDLPSGRIGAVTISSMRLTGVPIYASGQASAAITLPSGTVFGIEQHINAPAFQTDPSGNWMPYINPPVKVILLCVSIGS